MGLLHSLRIESLVLWFLDIEEKIMRFLPQWRSLLAGLIMVVGIGAENEVKSDFDVFKYVDPFIGTDKGGTRIS